MELQEVSVKALQLLKNLKSHPVVDEAVEKACKRLGCRTAREKNSVEEELKLQYYFQGQDVALVTTPEGQAVVAAGTLEEVSKSLNTLSQEERGRVTILYLPPWGTVFAFATIPR